MTLVKWTPRRSFLRPFSDIDRFFDSLIPRGFGSNFLHDVDWLPAFDVIESEKDYMIRVEAPGVKKSELNVTLKDGVLTVSGEKKVEESEDSDYYTHRESCYGRFSRSFRLPDDVEEKKIKSAYKNGVLSITIPRKNPVKPKEIEVEIS